MRDPDDYKLSDIYESKVFLDIDEMNEMLEEALISHAPKQQGFLRELGTRVFNRLGSTRAFYEKQAMDSYHKAWPLFLKAWKRNKKARKAFGKSDKANTYPLGWTINWLKGSGLKEPAKVAKDLGLSTSEELDRQAAGTFIFRCIQHDYELQVSLSKPPKSTYKLAPLKIRP